MSGMARSRRRTSDIRMTTPIKAKPESAYRALTSARELCAWWLERAETEARLPGQAQVRRQRYERAHQGQRLAQVGVGGQRGAGHGEPVRFITRGNAFCQLRSALNLPVLGYCFLDDSSITISCHGSG